MIRVLVHIPEYIGHNRGPELLFDVMNNLDRQENIFPISAEDEYEIESSQEFVEHLKSFQDYYDVLLVIQDADRLDKHVPDLGLLRQMKELNGHKPLIAYVDGSLNEVEDLLIDAGVTDCIDTGAKDVTLSRKIRRSLMQTSSSNFKALKVGSMEIDLESGDCSVNGVSVYLTGKETALMLALACKYKRTMSKGQLLESMYHKTPNDFPEEKIIDVFMCKIRKKLNDVEPGLSACLPTIWGKGYRLISLDDAKKIRASQDVGLTAFDVRNDFLVEGSSVNDDVSTLGIEFETAELP